MEPDFGRHEWDDRGRVRTVIAGCVIAAAIGAIVWLVISGVIVFFAMRS
ncbi:hypothetical protein [Nonomuraea lactucae]|nr:hypothetical protein [Nonomuraea lactucae]